MNDETITMDKETKESIRHTLGLYGLAEARHALAMLEAGRVDGTLYMRNGCGCLIGSLQSARSEYDGNFQRWLSEGNPDLHFGERHPSYDATEPAQRWFEDICPGHTPANSVHARLAHAAIKEWCDAQVVDLGKANPLLQPESTKQAIERLLKEVRHG